MNILHSAYTLLFDPQTFFAEKRDKLTVPIILTFLYAIVAGLFTIPTLLATLDSALPAGTSGIVAGVTIVSVIIGLFCSWIGVSAIFFGCLKLIGYAECSYSQVLAVCGYVSGVLLIGQVLTGLVSFIGIAHPLVLLILSGIFLLWSIPIWYFGFKSFCDIPEKKLKTAVLVPVFIMVIYSVISSLGTLGL